MDVADSPLSEYTARLIYQDLSNHDKERFLDALVGWFESGQYESFLAAYGFLDTPLLRSIESCSATAHVYEVLQKGALVQFHAKAPNIAKTLLVKCSLMSSETMFRFVYG